MTGSAKGDLPSTGEFTEVASANLGVLGALRELSDEDELEVPVRAGVRLRAAGRLLSSGNLLVEMLPWKSPEECGFDKPSPGIIVRARR